MSINSATSSHCKSINNTETGVLSIKDLTRVTIWRPYAKSHNPHETRFIREVAGVVGGMSLKCIADSTGATVGLHEVVGHGILGHSLTEVNASSTYQVNGWDRFHQMAHSDSFSSGIENFFKWFFTVEQGHLGSTTTQESSPNALGSAMGSEGQQAWISIAGSIPGLILDSGAVAGGMLLRKRSPILGNLFVMFGISDSITASCYAIDAATMSKGQMITAAGKGHDFANFALKMSDITGASATDIAITTATLWTLVVPLVAILSYLHTKSHITDAVPDVLALREWIQEKTNEEELNTHWENYCKKAKNPGLYDFVNYLLEKVPANKLTPFKTELLASWNQNVPTNRIQVGLNISASLGIVTSIAAKILTVVSIAHPEVTTAATTLSYIAPVLVATSVAAAAYQVYKDFQCDDSVIPKTAKMLSVAKLIVTLIAAILITIGIFQPFLNLIFPIALIASAILNVALNFARAKIVQKQYALNYAHSDTVKEVMYPLWETHQKIHPGKPMHEALAKWAKIVRPTLLQDSSTSGTVV